jgi:hypothetical protein
MPKASSARKKPAKIGTVLAAQQRAAPSADGASRPATAQPGPSSARVRRVPAQSGMAQNLAFPLMVALGCWGMAFTLAYFYTSDPNHLLFAGMAALMGLFWTYNVYARYTRMRKTRKMRKT